MKKTKTLKLPEDCDKLTVNACTAKKLEGKCRIKKGIFKDKCVPNEFYESDKAIFEEGFINFAQIDPENVDEELKNRDDLCKKLSPKKCKTLKAIEIGCELKYNWLGRKNCQLSKEIVNYFYRTKGKCSISGCEQSRIKGEKLCEDDMADFNQDYLEYNNYFDDIVYKKKNIEKNLFYFEDLYTAMKLKYTLFLLDKPDLLNSIEEMHMRVQRDIKKDQCQAYNITKCNTRKTKERCRNKGIENKNGLFCNIHSKCYDERIKVYKKIRDNLEKWCRKKEGGKNCSQFKSELKEFYNMIRFTTKGEANKIKNEILETLEIIDFYEKI